MNRELVVVVLISDWIKLYSGYNSINTISGYTTRDDNDNDDVIGTSRSTVVNTSVNNIGSITDTIINCNTPVDNNGNILGRYATSQSIIRINITKLMYDSTTIGYNSVGSNNDMILVRLVRIIKTICLWELRILTVLVVKGVLH